jgi:hypothetical protein
MNTVKTGYDARAGEENGNFTEILIITITS